MKAALVALILLGLTSVAYADAVNPMYFVIDKPIPGVHLRDGYCQDPAENFGIIINASAEFLSEVADDMPESLECDDFVGWDLLIGGWGDQWQDPYGIKISYYNSGCPPDYGPDQEVVYLWDGPFLHAELVWDDQYTAWAVHIEGQDQTHIENPMSIGIQVEDNGDQEPPFYGVVLTEPGNIGGQCEAYFSGDFYGYPRWTAMSEIDELGNQPYDMAWCVTTEDQQGCFLNCPAQDGGLVNVTGNGDKSPDLDFNGIVNVVDFSIFASHYSTTEYCADFDCNGIVALPDFALFAAHYGHEGIPGWCF